LFERYYFQLFLLGNYAHFLQDSWPIILWIRQNAAGLGDRFGLLDTDMHRQFVQWFDPDFAAIITWIPIDKVNCMSGVLVAPQYKFHQNNGRTCGDVWLISNPAFIRTIAIEMERIRPQSTNPIGDDCIIFYSRRSSHTFHGRVIPYEHENLMIEIIRDTMISFGRKEKLIIYNGEDVNGKMMTYEEQFRLFRRAKVVIGPHGSGLANILWIAPLSSPLIGCSNARAVLEIIGDDVTTEIGGITGSWSRSYFNNMGTVPWVNYYQLFLAHNSTEKALFVDLDHFAYAVNEIFRLQKARY